MQGGADEEAQTDFFGLTIPFSHHCGIEPVRMASGEAEFRVALARRHENSLGMAHGGLLATMLDMALASAARSTLAEDMTVMTIDMHCVFLAPARGVMHARGRVLRGGRTIQFCEADVVDAQGVVCARASGVFRATPKRAGGARGGDA